MGDRVRGNVHHGGRPVAAALPPAGWAAPERGALHVWVECGGDVGEAPSVEGHAASHDSASTHGLILDTAERHFAEYGFAAVTMRHIAMDAGLKNQASLYHHFRDKRALYEAALARGVEPIIALLAESAVATPAAAGAPVRRQGVETILDRLLDYLAEHPHVPLLIHRAALDDSRHLRDVIAPLLAPIYATGLSALAGSSARWAVDDLPHVALGIYHLIFGYFANASLLEVLLGGDLRGREGIERQRRFVKAAVVQLLGIGSPILNTEVMR
jgi:AcrR family transcriptional regulator